MEVRVANPCGFCFGVKRALDIAQSTLADAKPGQVVSLGPLIHNEQVVGRLKRTGLTQQRDVENIPPGSMVLIRSHGATPETLIKLSEAGMVVVDATCKLVKRAQQLAAQLAEEGYHVVVIGDAGHAEVRGIAGCAEPVTIIDSSTDLDAALPPAGRLGIVAQTTHARDEVATIVGNILRRPYREVRVIDTLCNEVARRQAAAIALGQEVDVLFVLGGLHSANTKEMARLCCQTGCRVYHVEDWAQVDAKMLADAHVAGVAAGASTPDWVITDFVRALEAQ